MHFKVCKWYFVYSMKNFLQKDKIPRKLIDEYCHGNCHICTKYQKKEIEIYYSDLRTLRRKFNDK